MSGYYAVLMNVDTGTTVTLGPWSWNAASGTAARAERRQDVTAGVIGRLDGGQA